MTIIHILEFAYKNRLCACTKFYIIPFSFCLCSWSFYFHIVQSIAFLLHRRQQINLKWEESMMCNVSMHYVRTLHFIVACPFPCHSIALHSYTNLNTKRRPLTRSFYWRVYCPCHFLQHVDNIRSACSAVRFSGSKICSVGDCLEWNVTILRTVPI